MIVVGLFLWLIVACDFCFAERPGSRSIAADAVRNRSHRSIIFIFTSVAALIMSRLERRKYGDYGLPMRHAFRNFWLGALSAFCRSACVYSRFYFATDSISLGWPFTAE